jgi:threonine aldolase
MQLIDLRSDTFTLPDEGMRKAIYAAEVGNAGFGEDPSVNRLEEELAAYFGVDAGLFLPSATMAGQVSIAVHGRPGDIVIIEEYGHSYFFETGAMGLVAGVQARTLAGRRGMLEPGPIEAAIVHPENPHARTSLIILENTSNFGGGTIYPQETLDHIFAMAGERHLPVHVDGARVWNAIVATGAEPQRLVQPDGSISVCFSKGLGAPMGALLLGPADFIAEGRRIQSMLGGVMRQVGFMAAAALYAFQHNMDRLAEDHANARLIAESLADNPAVQMDLEGVQTNILYFTPTGGADRAARLVSELESLGVGAWAVGEKIRLVTSLNVSRDDCVRAAAVINELLR